MTTNIEWVKSADGTKGATWNPIVGCTRVSPGCQHCYAERMAKRLAAMGQEKYQGTIDKNGRWTGVLNFADEKTINAPLRNKKPTTYFVNSMSDLFHESLPFLMVEAVWKVMYNAPWHTFQILTKRAEFMQERVRELSATFGLLENVWLGVSVENDDYTFRIDHLRQIPAAIRFLSLEPLLGPLPDLNLDGIHWVIVGGESGPDARPMHPNWARQIRDQCQAAGVPFFFKQWGEWIAKFQIATFVPIEGWGGDWEFGEGWLEKIKDKEWGCLDIAGEYLKETTTWNGRQNYPVDGYEITIYKISKHAAGRLLDGREWNEIPQREVVR